MPLWLPARWVSVAAMKRGLKWMFPGGGLLVLALILSSGFVPEGFLPALVSGYPWVVYGAGFLLAVFFHRSRIAVAVLALSGLAWVGSTKAGGFTALFFFGGLLALVLGAAAVMKDRGFFSMGGLVQVSILVVLGLFGGLFVSAAPGDMAAFLAADPLPNVLTVWSGFPQPVFLSFALALPVSLVAALVRRGAVERGVFWTLILTALGLYLSRETQVLTLFLMAGGLTLGLSVVETSYAMAYRDDLTGLPARRALMRDLDAIGGTYTVAMVDVDHFKKFNDRHGHDVGDQVLRMVAAQLNKTPGGGRAYRYGGEEFTVLFPGKNRDDALPHADSVRKAVEGATFILRHWRRPRKKPVDAGAWKFKDAGKPRHLNVTVSVGVADSTGLEGEPESVLKKADRALYRAKRGGRNRVSK